MTVVVMAAGLGTRFKGKMKQLTAIGENGETLMEYSIYGAKEAGFNKVIFIIRKEFEKQFKETIGNRVQKIMKVEYVYQEIDDIPTPFQYKNRQKPWGTLHAVLCCKDVVLEPFCVINADDFYGKESFEKIYNQLKSKETKECMVAYFLKNTLSKYGTVNRGICQIDDNCHLVDVKEFQNIKLENNIITGTYHHETQRLDLESYVSVNLWGFYPNIFPILEQAFEEFLQSNPKNDEECFLPEVINQAIKKNLIDVKVIGTKDHLLGMTYKEDKEIVRKEILRLFKPE